MVACHVVAYTMFSKIKNINFLNLTQVNDPFVADAKASMFINRLASRISGWIPEKSAPTAPIHTGGFLMGSAASAALFPSKKARETAMAVQAAEDARASNSLKL